MKAVVSSLIFVHKIWEFLRFCRSAFDEVLWKKASIAPRIPTVSVQCGSPTRAEFSDGLQHNSCELLTVQRDSGG